MKKIILVAGLAVALGGCGPTRSDSAFTGAAVGGVAGAVIGGAARRDRWVGFWVLMTGVAAVLMLGKFTVLFDYAHRIPVLGSSRIPVRFHLWLFLALAALTAGCCLVVIALTLAQALIALRRYTITAFAWVAGVAAFVAVMVFMSSDVFTRAEVAFVAGGVVAVGWMAVVTRSALHTLRES